MPSNWRTMRKVVSSPNGEQKYRPIYEKQAKENQSKAGGDKKSLTVNLPQAISDTKERNPTTDKKLSDLAGVSEKTYRMGANCRRPDRPLNYLVSPPIGWQSTC